MTASAVFANDGLHGFPGDSTAQGVEGQDTAPSVSVAGGFEHPTTNPYRLDNMGPDVAGR